MKQIREALAEALNSIDGLRASEYITESPSPPHAVFDFEVNPDLVFGQGADVYLFTITVLLNRVAERPAQAFADTLRDPRSATGMKRVLQEHPAITGACDYLRVTRVGAIEIIPWANATEFMAFKIDAEVVISS